MRYILLISCLLFSLNANAQDDASFSSWVYLADEDPMTDIITHKAIVLNLKNKIMGSVSFYCLKDKLFYFKVMLENLTDGAREDFAERLKEFYAVNMQIE